MKEQEREREGYKKQNYIQIVVVVHNTQLKCFTKHELLSIESYL